MNLSKGDRVVLSTRNGDVFATFSHIVSTTKVWYFKGDDNKAYERKNLDKVRLHKKAESSFQLTPPINSPKPQVQESQEKKRAF